MDRYEFGKESYDKGDKDKESCSTRCCSYALLWVNAALSAIGVALIIVDVYSYQTKQVHYLGGIDSVLFAVALVLGIITVLVSLIGCVGARTKSLCVFGIYAGGLVVAFVLECIIVVLCFDRAYLKATLQQRWNSLSAAKQQQLESSLNCCGFDGTDNYHAGSYSGNTNNTSTMHQCNGCYQTIANDLQGLQSAIGAITICLIAYELIMFGFTLCLYSKRRKEENPEAKVEAYNI